jgi:hypothetical protein
MKDDTVVHPPVVQVICVFEVKPKSMRASLLHGERSSMPPCLLEFERVNEAL